MNDFERAIVFVLGWETMWGKKIRHRAAGETWETMYGFSQQAHPEIDFDTFTEDKAKAKYLSDYWEKYGCSDIRWPLNFVHFDCCVNVGNETNGIWHGRANKILQRACSVTDDGQIGPNTMSAIREAGTMTLAIKMIVERQKYYRRDPGKRAQLISINLNGWMNRVEDLMLKALT